MVKDGLRTLGIDDSPFEFSGHKTELIGALYRGSTVLEQVYETDIIKDGLDATEKVVSLVEKTGQKQHLKAVFLDGITFGGLNTVDIKKIYTATRIPVVAVSKRKPSVSDVKKAIKNLENPGKRAENVDNAGRIFRKGDENLWYQKIGADIEKTERLIDKTRENSKIPEPLRVAHLIASRKKINGGNDRDF